MQYRWTAVPLALDAQISGVHHRLVAIHCFVNGNGRHARLAADCLMRVNGRAAFTWGAAGLAEESEIRRRYIEALRAADPQDCAPLLGFARA
jgi:fido (protein-threonine AMPylation protein)